MVAVLDTADKFQHLLFHNSVKSRVDVFVIEADFVSLDPSIPNAKQEIFSPTVKLRSTFFLSQALYFSQLRVRKLELKK